MLEPDLTVPGHDAYDVVIVGAGHAGAQVSIALRQQGFEGSILIVGDEPDLPYERPPLSKDYLSGNRSADRLMIRPADFWAQRSIDLRLGRRVTRVDPAIRQVLCEDGSAIDYRNLIWATGGQPRRLVCSGHSLEGVHTLRTRNDVDRMRAELDAVETVVVIGAGFIGLEAAAVLSTLNKRVIVLEQLDRVLGRMSAEPVSRFYEAEHRAHGVDIRLGVTVDCIEGREGRVAGVRLEGGEEIACEMVIVGIGIAPAVGPLVEAGAIGGNGVRVDSLCRTNLDGVFAIGDCALHPNRHADGALVRLESVQNANDQAGLVAKVLTGGQAEYDSIPWFWSNQYDLKLHTVGLSIGYDQAVMRGEPGDRSFSLIYLKEGRVVALDCVNAMRDFVQGKSLISRAVVDTSKLADSNIPLKDQVGMNPRAAAGIGSAPAV
ncbi:FAD-dependent oxidoreductase [soil metagenome]